MSSADRGVALHSASEWDQVFKALHGASRLRTDDSGNHWTGRLSWHRAAGYGTAFCSDGAQQVDRQAGHIRSDPRGTAELIVPLGGTARVRQGPADGEIRAGQIVLCDVDRPYTFAHRADFTSVAFIMPRDAVTAGARTAGEPRVFAMTPREARGGEPSREPAGHTPGRR